MKRPSTVRAQRSDEFLPDSGRDYTSGGLYHEGPVSCVNLHLKMISVIHDINHSHFQLILRRAGLAKFNAFWTHGHKDLPSRPQIGGRCNFDCLSIVQCDVRDTVDDETTSPLRRLVSPINSATN